MHLALARAVATCALAAALGATPAGSDAATAAPVWDAAREQPLASHPLASPGPRLAEATVARKLAQTTADPATRAGSTPPPASAADRSGSGGRRQKAGGSAVEPAGGKASSERYADCVQLWDSGTHMSKQAWARTCRRIENRLQNLQVENLDVDSMGAKARKKRKSPDAG